MMYLNLPALRKSRADLARFIGSAAPGAGLSQSEPGGGPGSHPRPGAISTPLRYVIIKRMLLQGFNDVMPDQAVILIAEDREDDILLMRRAFRSAAIPNPIHVVRDGDEAIAYLQGEAQYANRAEYPLPALMLLDLKMPRVDGFEVLRWLRGQPGLSTLRVIVLTSSSDMGDVNRAYHLGANSFLVKPTDFENFVAMTRFLHDHWLQTSKAPETSRAVERGTSVPEPGP